MKSKERLNILTALAVLEKHNDNVAEAADELQVAHVTLWRLLKRYAPDKIKQRRPKTDVDAIPKEVCLDIFTRCILKKEDVHDVADKYGFSVRATRGAIKRGRKYNGNA